jgi:hypothetical protein
VPARHRERSGEAGGPPGNRRGLVSVLEQHVAGGACPELVEGTLEDAWKDGYGLRIADLRFHLTEYDKIDGGSSS